MFFNCILQAFLMSVTFFSPFPFPFPFPFPLGCKSVWSRTSSGSSFIQANLP
ncbi:hypothetical protein ES288_D01G108600v1 [Gossypium darwinii]|uniref:Uncharacterized protein n=1 Tax=Gossypium darwinii TaxID=34276 RepID=A0A5D2DNR7_GOSDA|nr:hypothetical protein ES288_D01G108600v1 [Gossypium darwinii]